MFTVLSFPSVCSQIWATTNAEGNTGLLYGNPSNPDCWPGTRNTNTTTITPAVCPPGYYSAGNAIPATDASETVWACCPLGYTTDGGVLSCTSGDKITYTAFATDSDGSTITTLVYTQGVNAHSIRVAFHSSDFSTPTSSTSSTPIPSASTRSTVTEISNTSSPSPSPISISQNQGGPSFGAGIGIGVVIGVISTSILFGIAWFRRTGAKRRMKQPAELEASSLDQGAPGVEMQPMAHSEYYKPTMTPPSQYTSELPASEAATELSHNHRGF
ncbi:hypothetical protein F5Y14DRAFT_362465 [Nemania sp. NC0429]|nr:hypothetical protein F5Y14DRAFT_362465 [Nemania sp. NC0429]